MTNAYADEKKRKQRKARKNPENGNPNVYEIRELVSRGSDTAIRRLHNDISNAVNG